MAMTVVTTRFSGRTFNTQEMRTVSPRVALLGPAPCTAEAVFGEARAFLSSREARQMSVSDLERELQRRRQELVRKLLQEHRDQRSPREAAGPVEGASAGTVEGASSVECPERREHECHTETTSRTVQVPRQDCASRGHDGLHPLDAPLNLPLARYGVEVCGRTTIATAARAPPRTPLPVTAALDIFRAGGRAPAMRHRRKRAAPIPKSTLDEVRDVIAKLGAPIKLVWSNKFGHRSDIDDLETREHYAHSATSRFVGKHVYDTDDVLASGGRVLAEIAGGNPPHNAASTAEAVEHMCNVNAKLLSNSHLTGVQRESLRSLIFAGFEAAERLARSKETRAKNTEAK